MKTTIEQLEDCTLVTLEGELNTAASAEVNTILAPSLRMGVDVLSSNVKI